MAHYAHLQQVISKLGVTPQGAEFLLKALYPCGPETTVSIPDQSWDDTMRIQAAPTTNVSKPTGVDGNWDMLIFATPGDVRAFTVVTGPAGTDFSATAIPADTSVSVTYVTPNGAPIERPYYVNEHAKGLGNVYPHAYSNPGDVAAFRTVGRGITVHCTASDLYNGGSVTAGQFCAPPLPSRSFRASNIATNNVEFTNDDEIGSVTYFDVPLDENGIIQMCAGAQTTEARAGVFMPFRLLGPTQPFARPAVATDQMYNAYTNDGSGTGVYVWNVLDSVYDTNAAQYLYSARMMPAVPAVYLNPGTDGISQGQPWWIYASCEGGLNGEPPVYDTAFDNCATGVIIFRGLDPAATYSIQLWAALETIVYPTSVYRSLTTPGAPLDRRALEMYYLIANKMPYVYPASYNSLGLILPFIEEAMSALAPYVLPVAKQVAGAAIGWAGGKLAGLLKPPARQVVPPMNAAPKGRGRAPVPAAQAVVVPKRANLMLVAAKSKKSARKAKLKQAQTARSASARSVRSTASAKKRT